MRIKVKVTGATMHSLMVCIRLKDSLVWMMDHAACMMDVYDFETRSD